MQCIPLRLVRDVYGLSMDVCIDGVLVLGTCWVWLAVAVVDGDLPLVSLLLDEPSFAAVVPGFWVESLAAMLISKAEDEYFEAKFTDREEPSLRKRPRRQPTS